MTGVVQSLGPAAGGPPRPTPGRPLFRFGVVADVQHADIPDGFSFNGVPRYYRNALVLLRRAVQGFQAQPVDFALHMGDVRRAGGRDGRVVRVDLVCRQV